MTPTDLRGWKLRNWLRSAATRINSHPRDHAAHLAALGKLLLEVKSVLPHGRFRAWLRRNCQSAICYTDAKIAMRLAKDQPAEMATLRRFTPSAARVLAKRRVSKYGRANLLRLAERQKSVGYIEALCQISNTPANLPASIREPEESEPEQLLRLLGSLIIEGGSIFIAATRDEDNPQIVESYMVTLIGDVRRNVTRETLLKALAAAAGEEQLRQCPKCARELDPGWFAKSTSYCRTCERERVREAKRRKSEPVT